MKLDDLMRTLAAVKESRGLASDIDVHVITEVDGVQHEQLLGDVVVAVRYLEGEETGTPVKLMLVPEGFDE